MRFQRLDLNLLVALDVLLNEKSVTIAADKLCLSQSATSSALGRLREYFGDDLLVLKGRKMVLTSRGEELIEPTRAVLEQIRNTIAVSPQFDPATSERTFKIMASDYVTEVMLAPALAHFHRVAPQMRFELHNMSGDPVGMLERGNIDLLVTVDFATSSDHPSEVLFEDGYVVVGDKNNPAMAQEMTSALYLSLGHITVQFGRGAVPAFDDWYMRRRKEVRRVEVTAASFTSMATLIVGTNRICTMHRRLAEKLSRHMPLAIAPVPFDIPSIRELVQWSLTNDGDAGIKWLVRELKAMGNEYMPGDDTDRFERSKVSFEYKQS